MLRPLQSLDTYNDEYYHWSVMNRRKMGKMGPIVGGAAGPNGRGASVQPSPVWKEAKVYAEERVSKFHEAERARASKFAEEKKSLGQMVRTNVNRPKALLTTPVLHKEDVREKEDAEGTATSDSRYESEQRRNRVRLWRSRVAVDGGYSAFLSLVELRRLIQSSSTAPGLVGELMVDVKANVDRLHSSLGINVRMDRGGRKEVEVDRSGLGSALSLPKGRALCARVIEEGILPHHSACQVLPIAMTHVASRPPSTAEGEERLLLALMVLVRTPHPPVDPAILHGCLDMLISGTEEGEIELSNVTGSRARLQLLHSILEVGKGACTAAGPPLANEWSKREGVFMGLLNGVQK